MDTAANLHAQAFAGTAAAYLRFRPPYPRRLLADLLDLAGPRPGGVLLDLACGPGRVALDLASAFEQVLAIDLEPEMVAVGRQEAARRQIGNIDWSVGRAEEAPVAPASIDLITVGEAFHRLDQSVITAKALEWLRPGGSIAILGSDGVLVGGEPWKAAAAEVARRWMARAFPEGWAEGRPDADLGPGAPERVLRRAGFVEVESRAFAEPRDWSFEAIVGYLHSTSVCSQRALGDDAAAFEAELRTALGAEAHGVFQETYRSGFTLARKPG